MDGCDGHLQQNKGGYTDCQCFFARLRAAARYDPPVYITDIA